MKLVEHLQRAVELLRGPSCMDEDAELARSHVLAAWSAALNDGQLRAAQGAALHDTLRKVISQVLRGWFCEVPGGELGAVDWSILGELRRAVGSGAAEELLDELTDRIVAAVEGGSS